MKIIKIIFKFFLICVLLVAIVIAAIALYMKFYGKGLIEEKLSGIIGRKLKFDSVSLNIDKALVNFQGFTIPNEVGFESKTMFDSEKFIVKLDKEKFEKEKKIAIEEIVVDRAVLNLERNASGVFNISKIYSADSFGGKSGIAYASDGGSNDQVPVYNFAKNVKKLAITNSIINFRDSYITKKATLITCKNLNVNILANPASGSESEAILLNYGINFKILNQPRDGEISIKGDAAVHKDRVDTEGVINTENIDLMQFQPYFQKSTPFNFYEGIFRSQTKVAMHNNNINFLTTMIFRRLKLSVKPGMENTDFLEVAVDKLVPYLTSGSGEIIFDFIIKGPIEKPEMSVGPRVKEAIGMVVMEEVIKQLQKLQKQ